MQMVLTELVFNYGYNQTNSELSFTVDGTERVRFGGLGEIDRSVSGSVIGTGSFGRISTFKIMLGVMPDNKDLMYRTNWNYSNW